jgi:hypothetical protein
MKTEQIRVTPTLRVESGAKRRTAIATAAMKPDLDAAGRVLPADAQLRTTILPDGTVLAKHYKLGLPDALGKVISNGEEFTFLDHFGKPVWYFYQLEDVPLGDEFIARMAAELAKRTGSTVAVEDITAEMIAEWFGVSTVWVTPDPWRMKRFMPRDCFATKEEALAAAEALKE